MDANTQAMNSKSFIELFDWSANPLEGGEGNFGVVYKITSNRAVGKSYACKVIKQGPGMNVDDIRNEIRAIKKVSKSCHPNIVNILSISKDAWENKPAYFIQMELCDGDMDGYTRERYRQGKSFSGLEIADIMVQVLERLAFLHNHDEVHRDMKPKNVLFIDVWTIAQTELGEPVKKIWKIGDLGFVSPCGSGHQISSAQGRMTPSYCAPELILNGKYSKKVDIWAVGCITYELCTGKRAFLNLQGVLDYLHEPSSTCRRLDMEAQNMARDDCISLNNLVADCMALKPNARPDARTVKYRFTQLQMNMESRVLPVKSTEDDLIGGLRTSGHVDANGGDDDDQAILERAAFCFERGHYAEAESLYDWALTVCEAKLGKEHIDTGSAICGLANVYLSQGRFGEAEGLFCRCIQIYDRLQNCESKKNIEALTGLGIACQMQGRFEQAEQQYRRAIQIFDNLEDKSSWDISETLMQLGINHGCRGNYDMEYNLQHEVYKNRTNFYGTKHPDTAKVIRAIGMAQHHQGKYGAAEATHRWALEIQQELLGEEHPDTLETMNNLGMACSSQGRFDEAEALHQKVLQILPKSVAKDHPRMGETLQCLGVIYRHQNQHQKARDALENALSIQERRMGMQHPHRAMMLVDLAAVRISQRRYKDAEKMYREALDIIGKTLDLDHPAKAHALGGLGILLHHQGRHTAEEETQRRALKVSMTTLGASHPDTAKAMYNLGRACLWLKQYDEAEKHYRSALAIWEKALGNEHPYTVLTTQNLQSLKTRDHIKTKGGPIGRNLRELFARSIDPS